jgi:hypothetical protein
LEAAYKKVEFLLILLPIPIPNMFDGFLGAARKQRTVYEVAMDEVKFFVFGEGGKASIGTAYLGGCSAVIIASSYAVILAHIPPRPSADASDLHAGDRHAQEKMDEMAALYNANRTYFPRESSWVLCAMYAGELALPDQQKIMQDGLARLGLSFSLATYVVSDMNQERFPGQGTVYIDISGVYIEDQKVSKDYTQLGQWEASSSSQATSSYYPPNSSGTLGSYAAGPSTTPSYYSQGTAASADHPQYAAQTSEAAGSEYIEDGDIKLILKGNEEYYRIRCNGKSHDTRKAGWVEMPTVVNGQPSSYWAYTGRLSGTIYWRWTLTDVTTSYKGK